MLGCTEEIDHRPKDIHPAILEVYRKVATFGMSFSSIELGREVSAFSFAMMQEIYGVFGLTATAELLNCTDVPLPYKVSCIIVASLMMGLGSYQQWQKCRGKFVPGVYEKNTREPSGLPPMLAKISAFFEVLSVASTGSNFAQLFLASISETGMACVRKYFSYMSYLIPRFDGALIGLALMGPQMWFYYHQHSKVNYPWLTSIGYTFGSYLSSAFPIIIELMRGLGSVVENIVWLIVGAIIQIPKTRMLAHQHQHREKEQQILSPQTSSLFIESSPLLLNKNAQQEYNTHKTAVALIIPTLQTAFNARSMYSMATVMFPDDAPQMSMMIMLILIAIFAILVPIGRYMLYY